MDQCMDLRHCAGLAVVAASLFALAAGCSTRTNTAGAKTFAPVQLSAADNARSFAASSSSGVMASANNPRALAAAQPDTVLSGLSRDVDFGGGASGQQLTYQALGDALRQLGLTPQDKKDCYIMDVKTSTDDQITWNFPITVSLSHDQTVIWITCTFAQVSNSSDPGALINLLSANAQLGTAFFAVDDQHELLLQQAMNNAGVTPQILGANLKSFFNSLKQSEPLFKQFANVNGGSGPAKNPFD